MDVDVVERFVLVMEESFPNWSEIEVGVGEE